MSLGSGIDSYISGILDDLGEGRVQMSRGTSGRMLEILSGIAIPQLEGAGFSSSIIDAFRSRYLAGSDFGKMLLNGVSGSPGGSVVDLGVHAASMHYLNDGATPMAVPHYVSNEVTTSLPVASDVWYLFADDTVIPYVDRNSRQINEEKTRLLEEYLLPLLERILNDLKPLRRPMRAVDIQNGVNNGRYTLKRMRFEAWNPRQSQRFPGAPSYYDRIGSHVEINQTCAYLSFPVGPMGCMQVLSIVVPEVTVAMRNTGQWSDDFTLDVGGSRGHGWGGLFPHVVNSDDNRCVGLHIVESMYIPASPQIEYPAPHYYGSDEQTAHQWLRYYLKKDDVWPTPGTHVFMLGRPSPLHCWWFQESSPLAFAGGVFETAYYTSATVVRTLTQAEAGVGVVGQILLVEIYGQQLYVRASDFYPYQDGERVALLKHVGSTNFSFHWGQCVDYAEVSARNAATSTTTAQPYVVCEGLLVVPVSFY